MQETGKTPSAYFMYDINRYQTERAKLNKFIEYRKHFEKS